MQNRHQIVELAERQNDGKRVRLFWNRATGEVCVNVHTETEDFTLYPANSLALDCFHHPYAYAARALASGRLSTVS